MFVAYKVVSFRVYESIGRPIFGTLIMATILLLLRSVLPTNLISVWILIGIGAVLYIIAMYLIVGSSILVDAKKGIKAVFSRN